MIYVITQGCYSDYHICGVATSLDIAEKMRKFFSNRFNQANIEVFEENNYSLDYSPTHYYECQISTNGKQYFLKDYWDSNNLQIEICDDKYNTNFISIINIPYDDNKDKILKIAQDYRAQYLSEKFNI